MKLILYFFLIIDQLMNILPEVIGDCHVAICDRCNLWRCRNLWLKVSQFVTGVVFCHGKGHNLWQRQNMQLNDIYAINFDKFVVLLSLISYLGMKSWDLQVCDRAFTITHVDCVKKSNPWYNKIWLCLNVTIWSSQICLLFSFILL